MGRAGFLTHHMGAMPASTVFPPLGASEENGLPQTSARTQLPQSMKIMHEIMYKLEVLYVLCVLLMGRQRNQVGASPASGWRGGHMPHNLCVPGIPPLAFAQQIEG